MVMRSPGQAWQRSFTLENAQVRGLVFAPIGGR